MSISNDEIVSGCSVLGEWWYGQRVKKLKELAHESMSTNPFMLPFLIKFHGIEKPSELAALNVAAHLMAGHHTGFGKLVDEKILPNVFGTIKLDKKTRLDMGLRSAMFDDIDHIVHRNAGASLLSLKASRWTIQLGQALSLNKSFSAIREQHKKGENQYLETVIGVFYGSYDDLTDKYYLACGVKKTDAAADHELSDVSDYVSIKAGKDFWKWINDGQEGTEQAVLTGLTQGFSKGFDADNSTDYIDEFVNAYLETVSDETGNINPSEVLKRVNS